jgi:hypothetical protein
MPVKRATRKPRRQNGSIKATAKRGGRSVKRQKELAARPVSKGKSKRSSKSKPR